MIMRKQERKQARVLRTKGWSINQIVNNLHVAKSSVSVWVRDIQLTNNQKLLLKQRELLGGTKGRKTSKHKWCEYRKLNPKYTKSPRWPQREVEHFFDSWSPNMAYVLGYIAADGNLHINKRGACYTEFTSVDKDLILTVSCLMKVKNKINIRQAKGNNKEAYTIQIGSKKVFSRLLELGLTPAKSLTLKFPNVPKGLFFHFIRGFFDGDGCASFKTYKRTDRPKATITSLTIRLASGSKKFLEEIQKKISQYAQIGQGSLHKYSTIYELVYSTHDVLKLFDFIYPDSKVPCLLRKRRILESGLKFWGRSSVG